MHRYLPSKKFIYTVGSIVLAILIVLGVGQLNKKEAKPNNLNQISADDRNLVVDQFKLVDSDGDGVKDWEETLWKTDPKKADTDGDGTNDGEEILASRDPLKANTSPKDQEPNDKVSEEIITSNKKVEEEFKNLSATERFGRDIFSTYIAVRKLDTQLTGTEKYNIIENTVSGLPKISFTTYDKTELNIVDDTSPEALSWYSNALAEIILSNLKTKTETVDDILIDFSNEKDGEVDTEILNRLEPLLNKNKKTVDDLLKMYVPKNLEHEHLNILNDFQNIYESILIMIGAQTDIITLILPLNHYEQSVQSLANHLMEMRDRLFKLKVGFVSQTDYGYQLFNVIMLKN